MREILVDTAHYPCGDRVGAWQQILADCLAPFRVFPAPETPFRGQLRGRRLGPVDVVATTRAASVNHRPQRLISSHTGNTRLSLSLLLAGVRPPSPPHTTSRCACCTSCSPPRTRPWPAGSGSAGWNAPTMTWPIPRSQARRLPRSPTGGGSPTRRISAGPSRPPTASAPATIAGPSPPQGRSKIVLAVGGSVW
jgi:hypothetical protein